MRKHHNCYSSVHCPQDGCLLLRFRMSPTLAFSIKTLRIFCEFSVDGRSKCVGNDVFSNKSALVWTSVRDATVTIADCETR